MRRETGRREVESREEKKEEKRKKGSKGERKDEEQRVMLESRGRRRR